MAISVFILKNPGHIVVNYSNKGAKNSVAANVPTFTGQFGQLIFFFQRYLFNSWPEKQKTSLDVLNQQEATFTNINFTTHNMIDTYIFLFLYDTNDTCFSIMVNFKDVSNIINSGIVHCVFLSLAKTIYEPLRAINEYIIAFKLESLILN